MRCSLPKISRMVLSSFNLFVIQRRKEKTNTKESNNKASDKYLEYLT